MTTRLLAVFTLALALIFTASPARADKGGQHGNPHENGNAQGNGHGNPHGNPHAAKDRNEGWEHRGDYEYHTYAKGSVPPGWSHGKKTGWGNCGMPPGQAKKYGCQTYSYQGRPYYYYQNEAGQIFVRRPTIDVYGGVSIRP
jgi:hypothetical protein